jgi:predicted dehydrogenase
MDHQLIKPAMITRRRFLNQSGSLAAVTGLFHYIPAHVLGREGGPAANDQVRIGVIGTGPRSRQLIGDLPSPGKIVAIADCYKKRMIETQQQYQATWPMYQDYREMLDKEQLDAVIVATSEHGRVLPSIHAAQAGLDLYAEKPLAVYVKEGRALVDAVRKYKRICQVGTQQRTIELNRYCCEFVRDGGIGPIKHVSTMNWTNSNPYQPLPEEPIPEGDDWDMWCGPTPLRPFNSQLQFNWYSLRDYSGGQMTNYGAHGIDLIQWALGKSHTGPTEVWPESPGLNGKVSMRYADGTEVRFELDKGPDLGGIFVGEKAKIEINRNRFATNPADFISSETPAPETTEHLGGSGAKTHLKNWLNCLHSRELPNADVEIGHRSVTVCHLLNIARELGRRLQWNPDTEQFVGDDEANKLLDRPRRKGYELPETV